MKKNILIAIVAAVIGIVVFFGLNSPSSQDLLLGFRSGDHFDFVKKGWFHGFLDDKVKLVSLDTTVGAKRVFDYQNLDIILGIENLSAEDKTKFKSLYSQHKNADAIVVTHFVFLQDILVSTTINETKPGSVTELAAYCQAGVDQLKDIKFSAPQTQSFADATESQNPIEQLTYNSPPADIVCHSLSDPITKIPTLTRSMIVRDIPLIHKLLAK